MNDPYAAFVESARARSLELGASEAQANEAAYRARLACLRADGLLIDGEAPCDFIIDRDLASNGDPVHCDVCSSPLSDRVSRSLGRGPVCRSHFSVAASDVR